MNDIIRALQVDIDRAKERIKRCNHLFGEPFYNPETILEPSGFTQVAHGSDVYTEATGYREKEKPRWTKKCSLCGFEKSTYKTEPVIKEFKPKFD